MAENLPEAQSKGTKPEKSPYPKEYWLAGPMPFLAQPRVVVPGDRKLLEADNGCYVVYNEKQEKAVTGALGNQVFPGDLDVKSELVDSNTHWRTRSTRAFAAHQSLIPRLVG